MQEGLNQKMKMNKVTLITIANKKDIYLEFINNLKTQVNVNYELITIWNDKKQYSSARQAYNTAAAKSTGDILIFLHPDIRFTATTALSDIIFQLSSLKKFGVVGIAGSPKELVGGDRIIVTNIVHGKNKISVPNSTKINAPVEVQTVDEALFIMSKKFWEEHPFPSKEGWHLYAVEQCLIASKAGFKNFVIPIKDIWHTSDGKSEDYRYTLQVRKLVREYRKYTNTINTTVKRWRTRGIYAQIYILFYLFKMYIKFLLGR